MALSPHARIVIAGAGSVGAYLGGRLAAAGRTVTLLLREPLAERISRAGLRVSALDHSDETIPAPALTLATDPAEALRDAEVVLVTVKCRHTADMARLIAEHAPKHVVVVSLQNGVNNVAVLSKALGPEQRVVAGMVPFNAVQTIRDGETPRFHRASSGTIQIGRGVEGLAELLDVEGASFAERDDMDAVLWSKLLINLNNALNALSGVPLATQLGDRRWRLLQAKQMREGLNAVHAAGFGLARLEGVHPRLVAFAMRLRNPLFKLVARRAVAFDREARSSMWEDLQARRPTEVDFIQGEIVKLAKRHGGAAPVSERVIKLIKDAERAGKGSPGLSPEAVAG